MTTSNHDIHRARCVAMAPTGEIRVLIPQVLADQQAILYGWLGDAPESATDGLVAFVGGDPSFPVWLGRFVLAPS